MAGWAEQFLSQAGKETLIKAMAMAIPNHAMGCFKLPISERLRSQKHNGRLGFKDIQYFNLALLAKIGWRLIHRPDSLLANVLRDKYFPGKTFREACCGKGMFWGWKDRWFPKPSTFKARTREGLHATLVCDLINPDAVAWKIDVIVGGFYKEYVASILSIPLSRSIQGDRLVWHHSKNGVYTIKTGYGVALGLMENDDLGRKRRGAPSSNSNLNQV
ncbi:hypothetical protein PS1_004799 [Malus domestica]